MSRSRRGVADAASAAPSPLAPARGTPESPSATDHRTDNREEQALTFTTGVCPMAHKFLNTDGTPLDTILENVACHLPPFTRAFRLPLSSACRLPFGLVSLPASLRTAS